MIDYANTIVKEMIITPEQLHIWYLEATKELHPESFNENAQKKYEELTEEQKFIDRYISDKINYHTLRNAIRFKIGLKKTIRKAIDDELGEDSRLGKRIKENMGLEK